MIVPFGSQGDQLMAFVIEFEDGASIVVEDILCGQVWLVTQTPPTGLELEPIRRFMSLADLESFAADIGEAVRSGTMPTITKKGMVITESSRILA